MNIVVGSTNPVKVEAVRQAFSHLGIEIHVEGVEVESGVSAQPRSDTETKHGAAQRARKALKRTPAADIGIGLEGGVHKTRSGLLNTVWVCLIDRKHHREFVANGERFYLPPAVAHHILSGKEMGPALDEITGEANIKKGRGMIGVITKGLLTRTEIYAHLVKIAVGLWHGHGWEEAYSK